MAVPYKQGEESSDLKNKQGILSPAQQMSFSQLKPYVMHLVTNTRSLDDVKILLPKRLRNI